MWREDSDGTHMSLEGVGFGEGEERFPSMISLKLLLPTFLASCGGEIHHIIIIRSQPGSEEEQHLFTLKAR